MLLVNFADLVSAAATVVAPLTDTHKNISLDAPALISVAMLMSARVPVTSVTLIAVPSFVKVVTYEVLDVVVFTASFAALISVTHTQAEPS